MKHSRWAQIGGAAVVASLACAAVTLEAGAAPSGWLAVDGLIRFNPSSGSTVDWANSGLAGPTGTCSAGAVDVGGTKGLFNCGSPGASSAPPIAPTLTPAAAADRSIISATFVVDPIASDTTACGAGDPTTLNGGKNGDSISSYTFSTGPVPAKDDLSNVYAVSHTRSDTGHPEIYFGAERLVNNGDSHIDFEFLQSSVTLSAGCSGSFAGHRTQGDLLVAVDFTGGGSLAGNSVYLWHCAADPGPQPPDGTVCDPAGGPEHYELITSPGYATFTVNAADIPCGGWVCRDQITNNSTVVAANDFLEGGVDLAGIPFTGCYNTFLPHTRTAQSFTSVLKDFAGPINFRSCRDPAITSTSSPTAVSAPGTVAKDLVTVGNGGAGPAPTGTVTFFLCSPGQVTAAGCASGGVQVGTAKTLVAGSATSDSASAATTPGSYCWRAAYAPDVASTGVFVGQAHTNSTTECFSLAAATLPNTGVPDVLASTALPALPPLPPLAPAIFALGLAVALGWRRSRSIALILTAGLIAGAGPVPAAAPATAGAPPVQTVTHSRHITSQVHSPALSTEKAMVLAWRLVIPSIGVDAVIRSVGRDSHGAMVAPPTLDQVGWFELGPLPGQRGDAVIDGHYGLPREPAVFRELYRLRPGDIIQVIWPDGRVVGFHVTSLASVGASAQPPGLFSASGPPRLSLITCAGTWRNDVHTYTGRLIVEAAVA